MAITSETSKVTYNGDGSTVAFSVSYYFLDDADLEVIVEDAGGDETVQTIISDYSLSGAGDQSGGTCTMVTAPASGEKLIIRRKVAVTQPVDYVENDPFPAETHEEALDRITMIAQEHSEELDRSLKLKASSSYSDLSVNDPAAGQYLRWNSGGTGIESVALSVNPSVADVLTDDSPQLGGDLDCNGYNVQFDDATGIEDDSGNEQLIFQKTASAVNYVEITNAATLNAPTIAPAGSDTDVDLKLSGKTGGQVYITDATDKTKGITFRSVNATTGKTLTLSAAHTGNITIGLPTTDTDLVGWDTTDDLENKTIDATLNTITNLPYDIAFVAGFDASMATENVSVATYGELVMARTGSIVGEAGYADVAPTGAVLILDIEKNGTSVYSTTPRFATTSQTLTAGALKTDGTEDFVSGDRLTFKVTQIGSTEPGEGIRFTLKCEV